MNRNQIWGEWALADSWQIKEKWQRQTMSRLIENEKVNSTNQEPGTEVLFDVETLNNVSLGCLWQIQTMTPKELSGRLYDRLCLRFSRKLRRERMIVFPQTDRDECFDCSQQSARRSTWGKERKEKNKLQRAWTDVQECLKVSPPVRWWRRVRLCPAERRRALPAVTLLRNTKAHYWSWAHKLSAALSPLFSQRARWHEQLFGSICGLCFGVKGRALGRLCRRDVEC